MALSLGTSAALDSQRTRFTCALGAAAGSGGGERRQGGGRREEARLAHAALAMRIARTWPRPCLLLVGIDRRGEGGRGGHGLA